MKIIKDNHSVSICKSNSKCDMTDAFIDIQVDDDGDYPSPFKTVEDAKLFAEIIVKLLEAIYNDIE